MFVSVFLNLHPTIRTKEECVDDAMQMDRSNRSALAVRGQLAGDVEPSRKLLEVNDCVTTIESDCSSHECHGRFEMLMLR